MKEAPEFKVKFGHGGNIGKEKFGGVKGAKTRPAKKARLGKK